MNTFNYSEYLCYPGPLYEKSHASVTCGGGATTGQSYDRRTPQICRHGAQYALKLKLIANQMRRKVATAYTREIFCKSGEQQVRSLCYSTKSKVWVFSRILRVTPSNLQSTIIFNSRCLVNHLVKSLEIQIIEVVLKEDLN